MILSALVTLRPLKPRALPLLMEIQPRMERTPLRLLSGQLPTLLRRGIPTWCVWAMPIPLYVYSSGSVAAQKLLFGYSDVGDLTALFSGYFDTKVGMKRDSGSYQKIAEQIGLNADRILFLSDIVEELDAARETSMQTAWLVRDDQTDTSGTRHPVCHDFSEIRI